eukprot:s939_g7.t1
MTYHLLILLDSLFVVFPAFAAQIFPFPNKKFSFNLTHILLFAILISLLAMTHHPAQDALQTEAEKSVKKAEKKEKEKASKAE